MSGILYLIPTPVGNLKDITLRALEVLKEVDLVLAEDTRQSGILFKHYEIQTPMQSFHAHNEHEKVNYVLGLLEAGKNIGLVTDAGTPGISDPGFLAARACASKNIQVITLPGATAFVPALVNSGLPCDRFTFEGFLPVKKGRNTRLEELKEEKRTMVFYESPYKLLKTLTDLAERFGEDRKASISREISKMFEETRRGSLKELIEHFESHAPKGEFVLIVSGHAE